VRDAVRDRTDYVVEFRFLHASEEWRWMEGRGRAVYDVAGRPRVLYGIGIDITGRKRAEREQAFAAAIVASSEDAIIGKTLGGTITSWNAGAERLFGYTAGEAVGRPITLIIPPDRLDEEQRILARLGQGESIRQFETVRTRKDGTLFDIALTVSPVRDSDGRVIGVSKIARDITSRKRADQERERLLRGERMARERAEDASRVRDEFLATVSHELRTPLNAILGWARLLLEGQLDAGRARHAAEVVERNARVQAQLIEDLLDVSAIITGKMRLHVRPVMPAGVVEAALETVRPMAEAKEIRIDTALERDAGPVPADVGRLQQVVWNLLSNAIKFTPHGGHVSVGLERVDSQVEITVADTGQGIPAEFLPHVFDRFRQADSSSTRTSAGLGLGLAIVRHLVELHGGRVHVDSAGEGRGATFTVRLPIMLVKSVPADPDDRPAAPRATTSLAPPEFESPPRLDGVRVLLVDDEPDTRALLKEVLERCGAEVRDAGSAAEAFALVQQWRPSVLVSDIGMPGEDGYSLIRKVRDWEKHHGGWTPAMALTAYARAEDRKRALLAGYQVHAAKPIETAEFATVVASLVLPPVTQVD
jgi:PAS domain S-box-containing protein